MYFVRHPELTIVGSSPEPMVQLLDGTVISRPIAGTRKRGRTDEHDRRMAAELTEHPKERAEHVMLVDLARNDVGRVAHFGTRARRRADDARALQPRDAPHVAGVGRRCVDGLGPIDVLRATLPAGTVSGAPKVRAMEIIDELEPVKRGPYAGVVGYVDWSGNLDTAIAIRTMFCAPAGTSLQAGAGIVADSDPRRRGPRVPQQGRRPARRDPRGPPDDRRPPRRRHRRLTPDVARASRRLRARPSRPPEPAQNVLRRTSPRSRRRGRGRCRRRRSGASRPLPHARRVRELATEDRPDHSSARRRGTALRRRCSLALDAEGAARCCQSAPGAGQP